MGKNGCSIGHTRSERLVAEGSTATKFWSGNDLPIEPPTLSNLPERLKMEDGIGGDPSPRKWGGGGRLAENVGTDQFSLVGVKGGLSPLVLCSHFVQETFANGGHRIFQTPSSEPSIGPSMKAEMFCLALDTHLPKAKLLTFGFSHFGPCFVVKRWSPFICRSGQ